ncbi:MAG: hypothetical protein SVV03_03955 [Candidatus Nanohaloarchaea archaeon]|nr:hypothetical protein [Candidatus Nanohaloarchaea archaeon]
MSEDRYKKESSEEDPVSREDQERVRYGKETEDEDVDDKYKDGITREEQEESRYGKEVEEEGLSRD